MARIRFRLMLLIFLAGATCTAQAFNWNDLWQTKNQQGATLFSKGKSHEAAELFTSLEWKGSAYYRAGQYSKAAEAFKQSNTALSHYNLGNTLAQMGDFNQAIAAYNQALTLNPNFADAKFNRDLLEKLLQENPPQQQNKNQDQKQNSSSESSQNNQPDQSQEKPQQAQQQDKEQKQAQNDQQESQQRSSPKQPEQARAMAEQDNISEQNAEQMLRRVPDDPGGLLRQKFLRDHERYEHKQYGG